MATTWTAARLEHARSVLGIKSTVAEAAARLTDDLGETITASAIRDALRRHGMGPAKAMLKAPTMRVEELLEDADEVTHTVVRPTSAPAELERILIVPDAHHPYVDRLAWNTMLAAGREFKPHRIICLGDLGDLHCTSRHAKDPERRQSLRYEMDACNAALDELDALGAIHKHVTIGNHEENAERFIAEHCPQLFGLVRIPDLWRLAERGWECIPYRSYLKVGRVYYTHDTGSSGARAHVNSYAKFQHSCVIGHTHRAAVHYGGNVLGDHHVAIMSGWLGDASKASYAHDAQKQNDWMHAFTLGWMEPNGVTHFQVTPIIHGAAVVNGKIVRGEA